MQSFKAFFVAQSTVTQIDGGYKIDGIEYVGEEYEDLLDDVKATAYDLGKRWESLLPEVHKKNFPINESKDEKLLAVVYGGRFQPFHLGHYGVWKELVKKFSRSQVWIATSSKTNFTPEEGKVSPLDFSEKKNLITELYGIPDDRVIQCVNPTFTPKEVLALYKGPTVLVIVVGDKDTDRYSGSKYFQKWPERDGKPLSWNEFKDNAELVNGDSSSVSYYMVNSSRLLPGVTGTNVRDDLLKLQDEPSFLKAEFKRVFGKYDSQVCRMLMSKLKQIKKPKPKEAPKPKAEAEPKVKPTPKEVEPKSNEKPKAKEKSKEDSEVKA